MSDLQTIVNRNLLDQPSSTPSRQQRLYALIKQAILDGQLAAGTPLPSTRALAKELSIARNSTIHAYEQLVAEGFVISSSRGTVVAAIRPNRPAPPPTSRATDAFPALSERAHLYSKKRPLDDVVHPFKPGSPAVDAFPLSTWRRLMVEALRQVEPHELGYRHAAGEPELRQAISDYLRASRGVRCTADQVFVTGGTQQSLQLCCKLLTDIGDIAWIEDPGYQGARTAMQASGLQLHPVTVDEEGIAPQDQDWQEHPPKLIYTSPSHQYPLGSVLSLQRRLQLIAEAKTHGSWILEDDYDSEFRHIGPPLSAMQGLAEDAPVIYMGTFSKSMFPGLRLGFFVLPHFVAERAIGALDVWVRTGHVPEQRALAAFIHDGHYVKHLRRMRQLYAIRQQALKQALQASWPLPYRLLGGAGGMHVSLTLPHHISDKAVVTRAHAAGLRPNALSAYSLDQRNDRNGLVLGYGNVPERDMFVHIQSLANCLEPYTNQGSKLWNVERSQVASNSEVDLD